MLKKSGDSLLVTLTPPSTEDDSFSVSCTNPLFQSKLNAFAVSDIYSTSSPTAADNATTSSGSISVTDRLRGLLTRTPSSTSTSLDKASSAEIPLRVTLSTMMEKSIEVYPEVVLADDIKRRAIAEAKGSSSAAPKRTKLDNGSSGGSIKDDDDGDAWGDEKAPDEVLSLGSVIPMLCVSVCRLTSFISLM
jgi:hypothetical protein